MVLSFNFFQVKSSRNGIRVKYFNIKSLFQVKSSRNGIRVTYFNIREGNWTKDAKTYAIDEKDIVRDIKPPTERRLGSWRKAYVFQRDFSSLKNIKTR